MYAGPGRRIRGKMGGRGPLVAVEKGVKIAGEEDAAPRGQDPEGRSVARGGGAAGMPG